MAATSTSPSARPAVAASDNVVTTTLAGTASASAASSASQTEASPNATRRESRQRRRAASFHHRQRRSAGCRLPRADGPRSTFDAVHECVCGGRRREAGTAVPQGRACSHRTRTHDQYVSRSRAQALLSIAPRVLATALGFHKTAWLVTPSQRGFRGARSPPSVPRPDDNERKKLQAASEFLFARSAPAGEGLP